MIEAQYTQKFFKSEPTPDPRKLNYLVNDQKDQGKIFYYANACHVCHVFNNKEKLFKSCNKCNLVSYCSSSHQKLDLDRHMDLCKAICDVKEDLKQDYVFNSLKASNDPNKPISTIVNEARARIEFKAKLMALTGKKMKREFYPSELQMFNHPRVCSVCFECNPAFLTNCPKCPQATFCKEHLNNSDHQKICPKLLSAFTIESNANKLQEIIESVKEVKIVPQNEATELPSSIEKFIETYVQESEIVDPETGEQSANKISIISERFSMALSLLFAIEKLKYTPGDEMTVHLIGATEEDITSSDWEIILHWLPQLTKLKLVLISPNILLGKEQIYNVCSLYKENKKNLVVEVETSLYEEYFKSAHFKKPDIITAFNVSIYANPFWDEAMTVISSLSCPFLLTSYNQIEAYRKQEKISSALFGTNAKCIYFQPNPYASMIYMRSFVDEGICSKNYYMLLYNKKAAKFNNDEILN